MQDKLYLGNLNALRDWGYARDYVECMWLILQHDVPEDFVIATGEMHTVREFCTLAFREAGIELEWEGKGAEERGRDKKTGNILVEVDPKYFPARGSGTAPGRSHQGQNPARLEPHLHAV